jgi:hypothetical protein
MDRKKNMEELKAARAEPLPYKITTPQLRWGAAQDTILSHPADDSSLEKGALMRWGLRFPQ